MHEWHHPKTFDLLYIPHTEKNPVIKKSKKFIFRITNQDLSTQGNSAGNIIVIWNMEEKDTDRNTI